MRSVLRGVPVALGLALSLPAAAEMNIASGRITGTVVEAGSGAPIPGAIVVVKWIGGWSGVAHGGTNCIRSVAARSDAAGRFEIVAWERRYPDLQNLAFLAMAHAPAWITSKPLPHGGAVPFRLLGFPVGGIKVPPTEIRLQMTRTADAPLERAKALLALLAATDCRDGDAGDARDFLLAVRDEMAAMPAEVRDYRESPTKRSRLETVEEAYIKPLGGP